MTAAGPNARKGLKRYGMRCYLVPGFEPMLIERERRGHFKVRPLTWPPAFCYSEHRFLRDARRIAEWHANL